MKNIFFITGIGTDVGKTIVSAIITEALEADYWKPIQAGDLAYCDTLKVQRLVDNAKTQFHKNSYALQTPMSPHAAAAIDGVQIQSNAVTIPETDNTLVIEGAGGLLVPINDKETIVDLIQPDHKIIVVSRHYLGSINHTLMTLELLRQKRYTIAGVVFNGDPNPSTEDIILEMSGVRMLGRVNDEPEITPEVITRYADAFRKTLETL